MSDDAADLRRRVPRLRWSRVLISLPAVVVASFFVLGVLGPALAPYDPVDTDLAAVLHPPEAGHPLGTDHLGRDELSRLLAAARTSLEATVAVAAIALTVGLGVGLVAARAGGRVDEVLMRATDLFLGLPVLVVALALLGILGSGFWNLVLALSVSWWPPYARLARGIVAVETRKPYVEALGLLGVPRIRVLVRHLLPPALGPSLVLLSTDAGNIVLMVATLSFLGLGITPPTPEWGQMLVDARPYLQTATYLMLWPALSITLVVLGANLLGERLAARLLVGAEAPRTSLQARFGWGRPRAVDRNERESEATIVG